MTIANENATETEIVLKDGRSYFSITFRPRGELSLRKGRPFFFLRDKEVPIEPPALSPSQEGLVERVVTLLTRTGAKYHCLTLQGDLTITFESKEGRDEFAISDAALRIADLCKNLLKIREVCKPLPL